MIIDFHIHVARPEHAHRWTLDFIESTYEGEFLEMADQVLTPTGIRKFLQENGVDYAVALAEINPVTTGTCDNDYTIDFVRKANALPDPDGKPAGRLIPFCSINPFIDNNLGERLAQLVEAGFRGLKLYPVYQYHYVNEPRMYPLYAVAQELGIPILIHTGSSVFKGARIKYGNPLDVDDVAVDFPDLKLILAHSGRPFWYEEAFWMARLHKNVYLEISGLPARNLLTYFPRLETLANKVIYGSDWPGLPYLMKNVEAIRELPLDDETKRQILGGNAAEILGISLSPSNGKG